GGCPRQASDVIRSRGAHLINSLRERREPHSLSRRNTRKGSWHPISAGRRKDPHRSATAYGKRSACITRRASRARVGGSRNSNANVRASLRYASTLRCSPGLARPRICRRAKRAYGHHLWSSASRTVVARCAQSLAQVGGPRKHHLCFAALTQLARGRRNRARSVADHRCRSSYSQFLGAVACRPWLQVRTDHYSSYHPE